LERKIPAVVRKPGTRGARGVSVWRWAWLLRRRCGRISGGSRKRRRDQHRFSSRTTCKELLDGLGGGRRDDRCEKLPHGRGIPSGEFCEAWARAEAIAPTAKCNAARAAPTAYEVCGINRGPLARSWPGDYSERPGPQSKQARRFRHGEGRRGVQPEWAQPAAVANPGRAESAPAARHRTGTARPPLTVLRSSPPGHGQPSKQADRARASEPRTNGPGPPRRAGSRPGASHS